MAHVLAVLLATAALAWPGLFSQTSPAIVVAKELDTPWGLAFLPDAAILVTERRGTVRLIGSSAPLQAEPVRASIASRESSEGGLLGIALHPDFAKNGFVYLYYTYRDRGGRPANRIVRMTYSAGGLSNEKVILGDIPAASVHDGGRIKFGPDGYLYIGTGDSGNASLAQDTKSLAGKILRVTDEGAPAPGNPFGNEVYSFGHRNVQGLAWDEQGTLYATEHGRSGLVSGLDEINRIEAGKNYGWPVIQGDETRAGMETPLRHSGADTWAPSGAAFTNGSLYFAGLRGEALYEAVIRGKRVIELKEHFKGVFGRLRDVVLGPDRSLYFTTSNQDGRGNPSPGDDRVMRVAPGALSKDPMTGNRR
jgi:glucose/arabinose dehydrogenase